MRATQEVLNLNVRGESPIQPLSHYTATCPFVSCHVMSSHGAPCHVMLRPVASHRMASRHVASCPPCFKAYHLASCQRTPRHVMLCHVVSWYIISRIVAASFRFCVMSFNVRPCHVASCIFSSCCAVIVCRIPS